MPFNGVSIQETMQNGNQTPVLHPCSGQNLRIRPWVGSTDGLGSVAPMGLLASGGQGKPFGDYSVTLCMSTPKVPHDVARHSERAESAIE